MGFIFHRRIQKDIRSALVFYDDEGGPKLGDRFFAEAEQATMEVVKHPEGFHFIANGLRRAPLRSFPYHFVFEVVDGEIRFLVLRHAGAVRGCRSGTGAAGIQSLKVTPS